MKWLKDINNRQIRLTDERKKHIENDHPEMKGQIDKIQETLLHPDAIIKSKSDFTVELFYRHYDHTPINDKYLCVIVKTGREDSFIITAYFTDVIKKGNLIWRRKK